MSEKSNVVKEFKVGNITVKVCNDYFKEMTMDDINKSLLYISQILHNYNLSKYCSTV